MIFYRSNTREGLTKNSLIFLNYASGGAGSGTGSGGGCSSGSGTPWITSIVENQILNLAAGKIVPCFLSNGNANGKGPKQNLMTWIRKNTSHHLEERERNAKRAQDNPQGILQLRAEDLSRLQTDLFLLLRTDL